MKAYALRLIFILAAGAVASEAYSQQSHLERLPGESLDAQAPSDRVAGTPGAMRVLTATCDTLPMDEVRRRIVDVAVQEWAYFGFSIVDRTVPRTRSRRQSVQFSPGTPNAQDNRRRRRRMSAQEFSRLAPSIAGFWAVTPDGRWMLERQNDIALSPRGSSRWRDPWSAAFISWVMCEAGLGSSRQFERSIAHRDYIDQAIQARDGRASGAAFVAYDMGEAAINPGDLLCSGSRPDYQSINQRRREMGNGARTHCDIVVKVDTLAGRILTIGGNVSGTVSLKLFAAVREKGEHLHPRDDIFAHLKLRADPIELYALEDSPTIQAISCTAGFRPPTALASLDLPETNVC